MSPSLQKEGIKPEKKVCEEKAAIKRALGYLRGGEGPVKKVGVMFYLPHAYPKGARVKTR